MQDGATSSDSVFVILNADREGDGMDESDRREWEKLLSRNQTSEIEKQGRIHGIRCSETPL